MTNQDVLNRVWEWFVTMRHQRSAIKTGDPLLGYKCCYRSPRNTRCGVGCLIPDELYKDNFENTNVCYIIKHNPDIRALFAGVDSNLLHDVQVAHDEYAPEAKKGFANHMKRELAAIATKYNLQLPEP